MNSLFLCSTCAIPRDVDVFQIADPAGPPALEEEEEQQQQQQQQQSSQQPRRIDSSQLASTGASVEVSLFTLSNSQSAALPSANADEDLRARELDTAISAMRDAELRRSVYRAAPILLGSHQESYSRLFVPCAVSQASMTAESNDEDEYAPRCFDGLDPDEMLCVVASMSTPSSMSVPIGVSFVPLVALASRSRSESSTDPERATSGDDVVSFKFAHPVELFGPCELQLTIDLYVEDLSAMCNPIGVALGLPASHQLTAKQQAKLISTRYGCMPIHDLYRHFSYFMMASQRAYLQNGDDTAEQQQADNQTNLISLTTRATTNISLLANDDPENNQPIEPIRVSLGKKSPFFASVFSDLLRASRTTSGGVNRLSGFGKVRPVVRWELLTEIDLTRAIVGDQGLPPVLGVVSACRGLKKFVADRNTLTIASASPLFRTLSIHPSIESVSVCHNSFYESAGEELLRIVKMNKRILAFEIEGNAFSPYVKNRFKSYVASNNENRANDVFNPLATQYGFLNKATDVPDRVWKQLGVLWQMLTAERSSAALTPMTAATEDTLDSRARSPTVDGEHIVPLELFAPLFNSILTRTYNAMSAQVVDPVVRQLFMPFCLTQSESGPTIDAQRLASDLARAQLATENSPAMLTQLQQLHDERAQAAATSESAGDLSPKTNTSDSLDAFDADGLYGYRAIADTAEELLYPTSFAKVIVVPIKVMTTHPHRWGFAAAALKCLGNTHAQLGVRLTHYTAASKAMFDALLEDLGADAFNASLQAAWLQVVALVLRTVLSGAPALKM